MILSQNPDIVIKKADKGSAIVVMNTKDNLREGYRQLSDPNFSCQLDPDPIPKIREELDETLSQMRAKGLITDDNFDHLSIDNHSEGRFYLLPKIHKKSVPGRPISSSVNHPTSRISNLFMIILKDIYPTLNHTSETTKVLLLK